MASKRLQVTLSGSALEYIIERGKSHTTQPQLWATTGLRHALDQWFDSPQSGFRKWLEEHDATTDV